jgi:hypothetical protein
MKELGPYSAILTGGKAKSLLSWVVNNVIVLMLIVNVVNENNVNEDNPEQVLKKVVAEDVEQVLLVNVNVNNADVVNENNINVDVSEDNPEQILLNVVTEDVEQVLLLNLDHMDLNTETVENGDGDVDIETVENADVSNGNVAGNVNRTKVRSIEALVCGLRRAREQELL